MQTLKNSEFVKKELSLELDISYANFLDKYGDYEIEGFEIYGYSSEYKSIEEIPCVIGATRKYGAKYGLRHGEIVIGHHPIENGIYILENDSGHVYLIYPKSKEKIIEFKNFDTFFEDVTSLRKAKQ